MCYKKLMFAWTLVLLVIGFFTSSSAQIQNYYVSVPEENLRNAPNGLKIASLLEGTELTVLVDKGDWVKVQVTGWIWKGSISNMKTTATGQYRALHILVKTRAEAEALLTSLNGGADFSETAKRKSIAPNAVVGGDLGFFNKGDFAPEIENAIMPLKVNQVSGIVETSYGYNIFKRIK